MQTTDTRACARAQACLPACAEICHITFIACEIAHHDSASSPQLNVSPVIMSSAHAQPEGEPRARSANRRLRMLKVDACHVCLRPPSLFHFQVRPLKMWLFTANFAAASKKKKL